MYKSNSVREVMLVHRVTSSIHLISPVTSARVEVLSNVYFAKPMPVLLSSPHLVPFIVLDITPVSGEGECPDPAVILAEAEVYDAHSSFILALTINHRLHGSRIWALTTRPI